MLEERLKSWIREHQPLMADLQQVRELDLPQCYIAAGYIRNYAWDILHGYDRSDRHSDIDVVFLIRTMLPRTGTSIWSGD